MSQQLIREIEKEYMKKELPKFKVGDLIRVYVKVTEKKEDPKTKKIETKTRIQPFEGIVIAKRGSGLSATFTVRRVRHGIGVERIFPLHSPVIEKIEVIKSSKVKRARMYYIRERVGKSAMRVDEEKK